VVVRFRKALRGGRIVCEPRYEKLHNALVLMRTTRVLTLGPEPWKRNRDPRTVRLPASGDAFILATEAASMGLRFTKFANFTEVKLALPAKGSPLLRDEVFLAKNPIMSGVLNGPGREPLESKAGNRERPRFLDPCGALT
jgi:hypothetical protein